MVIAFEMKGCGIRFVHRVHEDGRVSIAFKNRDCGVHCADTCEKEQARLPDPISEALRDTTINLHNQGYLLLALGKRSLEMV